MLQLETYDGSKDLLDHLESFKTLIHLQGVADKIMCRVHYTERTHKDLVQYVDT